MNPNSEFYELVQKVVKKYHGLFNAHLHLDRSSTLDEKYLEHMGLNPIEASGYPLKVKQNLTGDLHRGPAYEKSDLRKRISRNLDRMIKVGTVRADSFIDVSCDKVQLTALEVALELKEEKKEQIDFRVGAYPIFGFKDSEPQRWDLFVEAASKADYLGCLPERDDQQHHPDHIGFDEHFKRTLKLAIELGKPIHYHLDQANSPQEKGTETLIQAVQWLGTPEIEANEPAIWAVHALSPSAYDENRFKALVEVLVKFNLGVICCPTAALSMRQLRPIVTPTHNSIARILDFIAADIPVRLGSDNIADVFLPGTTASLYDELLVLSNAIRFYNPEILGKLASGTKLTEMDRQLIVRHLEQDKEVFSKLKKI